MCSECSRETLRNTGVGEGRLNKRWLESKGMEYLDVWAMLVSEHSLYVMTLMMTLTGLWDVWGAALGGGTRAARIARNDLDQVHDIRHEDNDCTLNEGMVTDSGREIVLSNDEEGDYGPWPDG